jgi:hypothetical protein
VSDIPDRWEVRELPGGLALELLAACVSAASVLMGALFAVARNTEGLLLVIVILLVVVTRSAVG